MIGPDLSDRLPVVVHVLEDRNQLKLHVHGRLQPHDRRGELLTDTPSERSTCDRTKGKYEQKFSKLGHNGTAFYGQSNTDKLLGSKAEVTVK